MPNQIDITDYIDPNPMGAGLPIVYGAHRGTGWPFKIKDLTNSLIRREYKEIIPELLPMKTGEWKGAKTNDNYFALFWPTGYPYPFMVYFTGERPTNRHTLSTIRRNLPLSFFTLFDAQFYPGEALPKPARWFWVNGLAVPMAYAQHIGKGWLKKFYKGIISYTEGQITDKLHGLGFHDDTGLPATRPRWVEFWRKKRDTLGERYPELKTWPLGLFDRRREPRATWPAFARKPGAPMRRGVFKRETIEVARRVDRGWRKEPVEAWVYKGWAVHKPIGEPKPRAHYVITHVESGKIMVTLYMKEKDALAAAQQLADKWGDISGLSESEVIALARKGLHSDLRFMAENPGARLRVAA